MHKEELTDGQSLRGFALATIAFLAIFAATAIPIPLYADYQATIGAPRRISPTRCSPTSPAWP